MHITAVRPQGTNVETYRRANMAIYKVTDTKTGQTSTVDNLNDLFEKNKLEGDTYNAFVNELIASARLQAQMGVSIETVPTDEAIRLTREELAEATKRQKSAKERVKLFVMAALDELDDEDSDKDIKEEVEKILDASKAAPVNIIKWFDAQKDDKKSETDDQSKLILAEDVRAELEAEAKKRKEERSSSSSNK
jgi:hypothetical protein